MKPKKPYLRTSTYDYDTNAAGDESALKCEDPSLTQQHLKDETDINVLVKRFVVTGEIPQLNMPPLQGDFTEAPTYQEALNLMRDAQAAFMQQPADVRSRFDNDPGKFVDFCSNPDNHDKLRELGLWSDEAVAAHDAKAAADLAQRAKDAEDAAAFRASQGDPKTGVT